MTPLTSKKYLGVDIGSSGIRIVEIANEGRRARLLNYGCAKIHANLDLSLSTKKSQELVQGAIIRIKKQAKFSTNKAFGVIPGFFTVNEVFGFDVDIPKKTIEAWITKNIDVSKLDPDVFIKWQQLANPAKQRLDILANAVSKNIISRYKNVFRKAGLKLIGLETTYHALGRSLVGYDELPTLVIDIGEKFTDTTIMHNGTPHTSNSINYGSGNISDTIAQQLNLTRSQAEQFKKDSNFSYSAEIRSQHKQLGQDLRQTLSDFLHQSKTNKVDKVIISGGGSQDKKLTTAIGKSLGMKIFTGNPWSRITYREEIKPWLAEIAHQYPVAAGAAMKGIE